MKKLILMILAATAGIVMADAYPLTVCVVSGEKLGEMDKPYVFKHDGIEVQLCCDRCKAKFDKDPARYMAKLTNTRKPGN